MKRIIVGHQSEIHKKRSRVVMIGGVEIAVFQLTDGSFRAIENRCPHKSGRLSEGIVCDHHVYCPLHDWKINLKDGIVQVPDEGCVKSYGLEIDESGKIILLFEDTGILAS